MAGVGPGGPQRELLYGLCEASCLIGDARVDVEVIEVALNMDVRSPGVRARRVVDHEPCRIESLAEVVHFADPSPVASAQWERCSPILIHDCPDDNGRVV